MALISLPDEILSLILQQKFVTCSDVVNFGLTCHRFNSFVKNNQILWKLKTISSLPSDIVEIIKQQSEGDWFGDIKSYYMLKSNIYRYVGQMSEKYYWRMSGVFIRDIVELFEMALEKNINYYITIRILVDLFKKAQCYHNPEPDHAYTLTDMFYAGICLRYLIHMYLMLLGDQMDQKQMPPENVLQYFLQWVDTVNFHIEEISTNLIDQMVLKVENLLGDTHPLKSVSRETRKKWSKESLEDNMWAPKDSRCVLAAVMQVLQQTVVKVGDNVSLDTIDIKKITQNTHIITVLTVYEAIARRCGVRCELVTFPGHVYLQWKESFTNHARRSFMINVTSGQVEETSLCPYANREVHKSYCPKAMLMYLHTNYCRTMESISIRTVQNAHYLLCRFRENEWPHLQHDQYRSLVSVIKKLDKMSPCLTTPLNIRDMQPVHSNFIMESVRSNRVEDEGCKQLRVRRRVQGEPLLAVGMLCSHRSYKYVCVVLDWDAQFDPMYMSQHMSQHDTRQPFYTVLSSDFSRRYVAQEYLQELPHCIRLFHLEEELAHDFAHFNGYSYVPNAQKAAEYPDDGPVREFYRSRLHHVPAEHRTRETW